MEQYKEYKDSGVQWLGEIPSHWSVLMLQQIAREHYISNKNVHHQNLLSLSYGRVITKNIDTAGGLLPASFDTYQIVDKNNVVLRLTDLQNDHKSHRVGFSTQEGIITSAYLVLEALQNIVPEYLYLVLHTADLRKVFYGMGGGLRQGLNWAELRKLSIALPPIEEQTAIASYLDGQVKKIDAAIAQQQQMIDLLNERKQIIINKAVTRGLDDSVALKDSGVDWIGEIPEHWETPKLNFVTSKIGSGSTPRGGADVYVDDGIMFLRSQNIYNDGLRLDDVAHIVRRVHDKMRGTKVQPNDILFNITGGSIGRCCVFPSNIGEANVNQHVSIVRPFNIEPKYLMYYLQSDLGQNQMRVLLKGGNREGLAAEAFKNFVILVPNRDEQRAIVVSLDTKTTRIQEAIKVIEQQIALLQERKQIIINDVVTGKVKVV